MITFYYDMIIHISVLIANTTSTDKVRVRSVKGKMVKYCTLFFDCDVTISDLCQKPWVWEPN